VQAELDEKHSSAVTDLEVSSPLHHRGLTDEQKSLEAKHAAALEEAQVRTRWLIDYQAGSCVACVRCEAL